MAIRATLTLPHWQGADQYLGIASQSARRTADRRWMIQYEVTAAQDQDIDLATRYLMHEWLASDEIREERMAWQAANVGADARSWVAHPTQQARMTNWINDQRVIRKDRIYRPVGLHKHFLSDSGDDLVGQCYAHLKEQVEVTDIEDVFEEGQV